MDFVHLTGADGRYAYPETFGAGGAWVDYDGDGWLDLYLIQGGNLLPSGGTRPPPTNRLYRNLGRTAGSSLRFTDVTDSTGAGEEGYGMGAAAADVDGNGSVDLFVTNVGPNSLLLQRDRRFQERSAAAGVDDARWGTGTGFVDVDLDGDLDLVVVNYVPFDEERIPVCRRGSIRTYCDPDRYPGTGDLLYRNEGGGGDLFMTDVTHEAGLTGVGRGLGLAMADIDLDGDTDWFVANDGEANFLYRNDTGSGGPPRLTEAGLAWGVRFNADGRAEAGMGADFGDMDGDGWPDLVVANFSRETNTLYRHGGRENPGYTDETRLRGLASPSFLPLGFGAAWFDPDADGDLDLAVANGHVLDRIADIDGGLSHAQPDQLLVNDGNGRLSEDPAWTTGLPPLVSRALAVADFDNDGDEDLIVTANGAGARLLRNERGGGTWLSLTLVSMAPGNRSGLGALVEVRTGGRLLRRQVQGAGSYLSASDPRVHIGLDGAPGAKVTVRWPVGGRERWALAAGAHTLRQGSGSVDDGHR
ncbi:MAG: CRTAC1 family protein [Gemmatimonadaceae bacterium]|nr:CRTAC1 family protein [Gemmatimonadaceae bacterium]